MTLIKFSRPYSNGLQYGNDFFNNYMASYYNNGPLKLINPAANIFEETSHYRIELAVPGYSKSDFNIQIEKDLLTISAKKEAPSLENAKIIRNEFFQNGFERRFILGNTVDTSKIDATYSNGILELTLSKVEHAIPKPPKTIDIN